MTREPAKAEEHEEYDDDDYEDEDDVDVDDGTKKKTTRGPRFSSWCHSDGIPV